MGFERRADAGDGVGGLKVGGGVYGGGSEDARAEELGKRALLSFYDDSRCPVVRAMLFNIRLPLLFVATSVFATPPVADFTGGRDAQGWGDAHDIAKVESSPEGLKLKASGGDPFLIGPH